VSTNDLLDALQGYGRVNAWEMSLEFSDTGQFATLYKGSADSFVDWLYSHN